MKTFRSPAKINLFLRVLHRRIDGYHELASLFQAITLSDFLHLKLSDVDCLTCTNAELPMDHKNLVVKALQLFRQRTGLKFGLTAHLEKNIPLQAGLGGGSSNAATLLWGLNHILNSPVSLQELIAWGAEIGSDVPFFLSQGTAYCTGRGEIVQNLPFLKGEGFWIAKPSAGVPTPAVYAQLKVDQLEPRDPQHALGQWLGGNVIYFNDLEASALKMAPFLSEVKQSLLACGFSTVLLSGSGSSFICIGQPKEPLPSLQFYQVSFINRDNHSWY
jgi:4-diphosphocytidyl-2-C-methyl-D-erythritol kinase